MNPTLKIYTLINRSQKFVADVTHTAMGWRRSVRSLGGYWMGNFTFQTVDNPNSLIDKFYSWLGYDVREESGGYVTWEGLIYSMDLTHKGLIRRHSLELMSNYVTVEYLDNKGANHFTTAGQNAEALAFFGRKEALLTYDGIGTTAADAYRDRYLNEYGYPYPRVVGINPNVAMLGMSDSVTTLEVQCCGYVFTGNWRFETAGDGSLDNLSDYITDIITTDCEFLEIGYITPNTLQIYKDTPGQRRAWDVIAGLVEIGDVNSNPYNFMVDNNRMAYYKQIDTDPKYYLRNGQVYSAATGNVPADIWRMKPAVIRDMDYPSTRVYSGGWLADIQNFYAYELDCGVDTGLNIKTNLFDESEMLISLENYLRENEREHEEEKD